MRNMLHAVFGKVFVHPATGFEYGPIRVPDELARFPTSVGATHLTVAEDGCGNRFMQDQHGSIWFWDHETEDMVQLARSEADFVAHLAEPMPQQLHPGQVQSAWMDPQFAKSMGVAVHADGWLKKPDDKKSLWQRLVHLCGGKS